MRLNGSLEPLGHGYDPYDLSICMRLEKLRKYPLESWERIFFFRLSRTGPMSDYLGIPCGPQHYYRGPRHYCCIP